jgi:SSS family solute:Na+ symporter
MPMKKKLVWVGRWTVIISIAIAGLVAPALKTLDQAYQFIQEYVGFISPGVLAIFLMGFFWKRTTAAAAMTGALMTIPLSTILKFLPVWTNGWFPDYPFLDRMSITFGLIIFMMVLISLLKPEVNRKKEMEVDVSMFKVNPGFIFGSLIIFGILIALYSVFLVGG